MMIFSTPLTIKNSYGEFTDITCGVKIFIAKYALKYGANNMDKNCIQYFDFC